MRILGITEKWPKLQQPIWTTFRLRRRDKDWQEGEVVQVVYKPRSKGREVLGIARIAKKEQRWLWGNFVGDTPFLTREAVEDGFQNLAEMKAWMLKAHGDRVEKEPLNKLTLAWIKI